MATKEEILNAKTGGFLYIYKNIIEGPVDYVYEAMDEYAKEQSIEFAEYIKDNSYTKSGKGWYQYYIKVEDMGNYCFSQPVYNFITIDEIFELYIQSKK